MMSEELEAQEIEAMIRQEELTYQEIDVLIRFVEKKLRYEQRRAMLEPDLGQYKLQGLYTIAEKLERMKLAS
jgi:hypothetical protein